MKKLADRLIVASQNRFILPLAVIAFALFFRLVDFNVTSVTYDEAAAKESGSWWKLIGRGDFTSPEWCSNKARSTLMLYFYGVIPEAILGSDPNDPYDLVGARLMAVLLSSGLVYGVFLLGRQVAGTSIGVLAALTFSIFPAILGHDRFASHDLPARFASLWSLLNLVRYFQQENRRSWLASALWAGLSFAAYFRVGTQTILILQTALLLRFLSGISSREARSRQLFPLLVFGPLSLLAGVGIFVLSWPYAWGQPVQALVESMAHYVNVASTGGNMEWFLGTIQPVPGHYYIVVYFCTMPLMILAAHGVGMAATWPQVRQGREALLLWLTAFMPLLLGGLSFRSSLNHYLLICYPAVCVLAALGARAGTGWLAGRFHHRWLWQLGLALVLIGSELIIVVRIHPYYLYFLNDLVGGTRGAARNHTLMVGWYGDNINPLFDYVNRNAPPKATVMCRLGPWSGLADLKRNLRKDLEIQGYSSINPLGPDYVLRVGSETCGQFYRWTPNPAYYEKVMDVLAMGGSIADVWKRREELQASDLLYNDDFGSPQVLRLAVGGANFNLNIFSDGKLYAARARAPAAVAFKVPAIFLKGRTRFVCQADIQMRQGEILILAGETLKTLKEVARARCCQGTIQSAEFSHPPSKDLLVCLRWISHCEWDGNPFHFWDTDWIDSLKVFGR